MGLDVTDYGAVGVRNKEVRNIFQSGHLSHSPVWIIDMGSEPPHLLGTGGVS